MFPPKLTGPGKKHIDFSLGEGGGDAFFQTSQQPISVRHDQ